MALETRIVGPWTGSNRNKKRTNEKLDIVNWQQRVRLFSRGARAYMEIWPKGYVRGDKRVRRAKPPAVPSLPRLTVRHSPNRGSRMGQRVTGIVIHKMEGSYAGGVSWLTNPRSSVSAHLCINDDGSRAEQLVDFSDAAWHIRGANSHTIGIEMSGWSSRPADIRQVRATARIVAYLCHRYGIPPRQGNAQARGGIVGHKQVAGHAGNSDPGGFGWSMFLALVREEYKVGFANRLVWGRN